MRLTFRAALLGCALLAGLPAQAQTQPTPPAAPPQGMAPLPIGPGARPLSLEEAEAALVERNLAVIAARRGVDAARAQRLVASSRPAPTVSVGNSFAQVGETRNGALRGSCYLSPAKKISVWLTVLVVRG